MKPEDKTGSSAVSGQQSCPTETAGIVPMIFIVGSSGSGKTTLLEKLIRVFIQNGVRVGTIKHDVHGFDMDRPGKDTWRHKQAGAKATIISSPRQIGMVRDADHDHSPGELAGLMPNLDLVFVEGYKRAQRPKIEVFRVETGKPPVCRNDENLLAVVSDVQQDWGVPCFPVDDIDALALFIAERFSLPFYASLHRV